MMASPTSRQTLSRHWLKICHVTWFQTSLTLALERLVRNSMLYFFFKTEIRRHAILFFLLVMRLRLEHQTMFHVHGLVFGYYVITFALLFIYTDTKAECLSTPQNCSFCDPENSFEEDAIFQNLVVYAENLEPSGGEWLNLLKSQTAMTVSRLQSGEISILNITWQWPL